MYSYVAGKNLRKYVELASTALNTASDALTVWNGAFPSDAAGMALAFFEIAKVAAANAEQLFLNGSIGQDERKQAAKDYAYAALEVIGVELTDSIRRIVDGAIEAACLLDIPHKET